MNRIWAHAGMDSGHNGEWDEYEDPQGQIQIREGNYEVPQEKIHYKKKKKKKKDSQASFVGLGNRA